MYAEGVTEASDEPLGRWMIDESIFDQMNETDQDDVASDKSIFGAEFVRRGISKDVIIDLTTVSHEDVSIAGKSRDNVDVDFLAEADASVDIDLTEADSLVDADSLVTADSLVGAGSAATARTTPGEVPEPGTISLFGERTPLPKLDEPDDGADSEALKKIAALPVGESLFDRAVPTLPVSDGAADGTPAPIDFVPVEDSSFGPWWLRPMLVVGARTALAGAAVVALVTFWPSGAADSDLETTREPLTSTTVLAAPTPETSIVADVVTPSTLLSPVTTLAIATAEVAPADAPATPAAPVAPTPTTVRRRPVTTQPPTTRAPTTTVVVSTTVVATSPPPTFGTTSKPATTVTPTTATPATPAPTTAVTAAPTPSAVTAAPVTAAPATAAPATSAIVDEAGE